MDNGLSAVGRQNFTLINIDLISVGPSVTNFNETLIRLAMKIHLKISCTNCKLFSFGLNVKYNMGRSLHDASVLSLLAVLGWFQNDLLISRQRYIRKQDLDNMPTKTDMTNFVENVWMNPVRFAAFQPSRTRMWKCKILETGSHLPTWIYFNLRTDK